MRSRRRRRARRDDRRADRRDDLWSRRRRALAAGLGLLLGPGGPAAAGGEPPDPAALWSERCAACHEGGVAKAPHRVALQLMAPESIVRALESGTMREHGEALPPDALRALAEHLSGRAPGDREPEAPACRGAARRLDRARPPSLRGFGFDARNTRSVDASAAGLDAASIPRLALRWAFALPMASRARSQPAVAGGGVYVGSPTGHVYALDLDSGCLRWSFRARAEVRTSVVVEPWRAGDDAAAPAAFFADLLAHVYAVDAETGRARWEVDVDEHPHATVTGTPALHAGRLYVPISSLETGPAADPTHACCTSRGAVVALDAGTGAVLWRTPTIPEPAARRGVNSAGTPRFGPSGASVWGAPTVDAERGLLYVGTGQNFSEPATATSDAVLALDLETGRIAWTRQATAGDVWNAACEAPPEGAPLPESFDAAQTPPTARVGRANCPADPGPDADFGAPPVLVHLDDGGDVLVAGQKSGVAWGLAPDDAGAVRWRTRVGRGGIQGGIHFGMAARGGRAFVGVSDDDDGHAHAHAPRPGLHALDASSGEPLWSALHEDRCGDRAFCAPGVSAPVTAMPGAVFAAGLDGWLRAYDERDGRLLWEHDTTRPVRTVSGARARGGSIAGAGPVLADGALVVVSGYGIYGHMPGNVLLVFAPEPPGEPNSSRAQDNSAP